MKRIAGMELSDPPIFASAITPADADLTTPIRAIYVGTGGDLKVTLCDMTSGTYVTYVNVPSGTRLSGMFTRVWAATTASNLLGEY